jgi:hypothetical protein
MADAASGRYSSPRTDWITIPAPAGRAAIDIDLHCIRLRRRVQPAKRASSVSFATGRGAARNSTSNSLRSRGGRSNGVPRTVSSRESGSSEAAPSDSGAAPAPPLRRIQPHRQLHQ